MPEVLPEEACVVRGVCPIVTVALSLLLSARVRAYIFSLRRWAIASAVIFAGSCLLFADNRRYSVLAYYQSIDKSAAGWPQGFVPTRRDNRYSHCVLPSFE